MAYKGKIIGKCGQEKPYTGKGNCPKGEGKTMGIIVTGLNSYFPLEQTEFENNLIGYVSSEGANWMSPITNIVEDTPSGDDFAVSTIGYGGARPTGLNQASTIFRVSLGECFYKEISKLDKKDVRIFRYDDEGYIYGTVKTIDNIDYFAGFEAVIFSAPLKSTGNDSTYGVNLGVWYGNNYRQERIDSHAFPINFPDGLTAVTLQKGTATGTATVIEVCGGQDLTNMFDWTDPSIFANPSGTAPTTVALTNGELTFDPVAAYRIKDAAALQAQDIPGLAGVAEFVNLA